MDIRTTGKLEVSVEVRNLYARVDGVQYRVSRDSSDNFMEPTLSKWVEFDNGWQVVYENTRPLIAAIENAFENED